MNMTDNNGWSKAEMHVIGKLEEHDDNFKTIWRKLDGIRNAIAEVKVKLGLMVAIAMILSTALATAVARYLTP